MRKGESGSKGEDHAWNKCRVWESHSQEILHMRGVFGNFEGKFTIEIDISVFLLQKNQIIW